jgi:hypothetical protein
MDLCEEIVNFIDCAVSTIIKSRKIYSETFFEKRLKYGISIWKCRHPDVSGYIERVVKNMIPLLNKVNFINKYKFKI